MSWKLEDRIVDRLDEAISDDRENREAQKCSE